MGIIFFRTILVYFLVFLIMRVMGKREIGKLSVIDLVIFIMLAEIAVFVIEDADKPFMEGFVPLITLAALQIGLSYAALRSRMIRNLFEGNPSYLIRHGKLDREEMRKQRFSLDDLMMQLRSHKIADLRDVEFAILETSGKLNVVEKQENKAEAHPEFQLAYLPLPLIMDGKVVAESLERIGKSEEWLLTKLAEQGVAKYEDVFYCSVNAQGQLYIDCLDS